mgnify:CR=1 FL=1
MARIAGVNVPDNKHAEIALTSIFGIGRITAQKICTAVGIDYSKKILLQLKRKRTLKISIRITGLRSNFR